MAGTPTEDDYDREDETDDGVAAAAEAARSRLVEDFLPLAMKLALKFCVCYPGHDAEYHSAALFGLFEAGRGDRFDDSLSCFYTFASGRIRSRLLDTHRRLRVERRRACRLKQGLLRRQPGAVRHNGSAMSRRPAEHERAVDDAEAFEALVRPMSRRDALAARLVYADGLTHVEAGAKLGLSQSRVSAVLKAAAAEMRRAATEHEL